MHIINDFFLLTWSYKDEVSTLFNEEELATLSHNYTYDVDRFCDSVAIALIIHPQNLGNIAKLSSTQEILNKLFTRIAFTREMIQKVQKTLLLFLIEKGNLTINQAIAQRFERLRKEEIISYDVSRRLMSFISLIEEKKEERIVLETIEEKAQTQSFDYHSAVQNLLSLGEKLLHVTQDKTLQERVNQAMQRMKNATFSIGITGVMNAGKSTMLNALLGKELLGTAVVPETANLTIIGYAKDSYAKVNFWTQSQWENIEQSASTLSSMEAFVKETKAHFGAQFEKLVTLKGKSETIELDSLGKYTSAKESDKKCNLVKSVELFTDLSLLEEGVVIVDTPGLDDPVVQREEITLSYLNECDVLIHLMNAAQAATQKDVDFIIDALLYRKVAQLLVVITRIDAITPAQLEEVIAYTKQSIHKRLEEHNKGSFLAEIIAKLHFIPIAGKLGLWHKLGRESEALALGYDFEKTGLPHLEAYLKELLFGEESAKAKITLASNAKEIAHVAFTCKEMCEEKASLLLLSKEEISARYEHYKREKHSIERFLEQIFSSIEAVKSDTQHYFKTLHLFADNKIEALGRILYRRVVDDVNYELSKYKRLPKEERIAYMVESGFKDGLLDVIRDYRYEFQKKMERNLESLHAQYDAFEANSEREAFDIKAFCENHFAKTMIFKNTTAVVARINQSIAKDAKRENHVLDKRIEEILNEEVRLLKALLWESLSALNEVLLNAFTESVNAPALEIKMQMKRKEEILHTTLEQLQNSSLDEAAQKADLEQKLRVIESVLEALHVRRDV